MTSQHYIPQSGMRLMLAAQWAERRFDAACRPDERTVRAWVRAGVIPGREIGRRVYVDDAAFDRLAGNPLADKIIAAQGRSHESGVRS